MTTPSHVRIDSFICATWCMHTCGMPYLHVWHDSFVCETCLYSYVRLDSFPYATWPIPICNLNLHMCDMTDLHVWHDWLACATWLIYICDMIHVAHVNGAWRDNTCECIVMGIGLDVTTMCCCHVKPHSLDGGYDAFVCATTHSHVRLDSFSRETWLIHTWDTTHSYMWRDSFICATWLIHMWDLIHAYVRRLVHMCDFESFICATRIIYFCDMTYLQVRLEWLSRLLKIIGLFCKRDL